MGAIARVRDSDRMQSAPGARQIVRATLLAVVLAGCGSEREVVGPQPAPPGGGSLATLVVHARLPDSEVDLAGTLGWEDGVPGALVSVLRNGTGEWIRVTTDASGQATIPGLLSGLYRVVIGRDLTSDEASAAQLPFGTFGDGVTRQVPATGELRVDFELSPHRSGTLVISDVNGWTPPPWETGASYTDAHYFEVFNNSDAIQFLDGLVFGATLRAKETTGGHCAASQEARSDPLGVYATQMIAWPGTGGEYPVMPGETKLIALSAIDHTSVHEDLYDLSHADFEIAGARNADNPSVPNMKDVGLDPFMLPFGGAALTPLQPGPHGYFIARSFDPQSAPILYRDLLGRGYVRVEHDMLIDVVAHTPLWPDQDREFPPCVPTFDPAFDRYEGGYYPISLGVEEQRASFQRRLLGFVGGRAVLSNSNTSAVDFVLGELTPGTLAR